MIDSYANKISCKLMQSVGFVAPPQLDRERVRRLAQLHLQGFVYLITYNEARETDGCTLARATGSMKPVAATGITRSSAALRT